MIFTLDTSLFGKDDFTQVSFFKCLTPRRTTWLICIVMRKPSWQPSWKSHFTTTTATTIKEDEFGTKTFSPVLKKGSIIRAGANNLF